MKSASQSPFYGRRLSLLRQREDSFATPGLKTGDRAAWHQLKETGPGKKRAPANLESAQQPTSQAGRERALRPVRASNPNPTKPNSDMSHVDGSKTAPAAALTEKYQVHSNYCHS
jgi:hypothetical protein